MRDIALAVALAALLIIAGCGGDKEKAEEASGAAAVRTPQSTVENVPAPEVVKVVPVADPQPAMENVLAAKDNVGKARENVKVAAVEVAKPDCPPQVRERVRPPLNSADAQLGYTQAELEATQAQIAEIKRTRDENERTYSMSLVAKDGTIDQLRAAARADAESYRTAMEDLRRAAKGDVEAVRSSAKQESEAAAKALKQEQDKNAKLTKENAGLRDEAVRATQHWLIGIGVFLYVSFGVALVLWIKTGLFMGGWVAGICASVATICITIASLLPTIIAISKVVIVIVIMVVVVAVAFAAYAFFHHDPKTQVKK